MRHRRARAGLAWLIACAVVAGCGENGADSNRGPSPLPSSIAVRLVDLMPVVGKDSFGPGVDVRFMRPPWLFSEARVADDTLYVTYYPQDGQEQQIASLSRGVLRRVRFPSVYWVLSFENDNRVILAKGSGDERDWYELRGDQASPIARPGAPVYGIPHHVLADGDTCAEGLPGSDSALDDIRDHRRVSILSAAAMAHATGGLIRQAIEVYCDHFNGKNYATLDVPGAIFRIDGDAATPIAAGRVEASNEHHMLIESQDSFIDLDSR